MEVASFFNQALERLWISPSHFQYERSDAAPAQGSAVKLAVHILPVANGEFRVVFRPSAE
jgi:hypothetical protein